MKYCFCFTAILVGVLLLSGNQFTQAQDAFVLEAAAHGSGSGAGDLPYTNTLFGPEPGTVTGSGTGTGNGTQIVSSEANIHDDGSDSPYASSSSNAMSNSASGAAPAARGHSLVIYGDGVILTGTDPLPSSIRLHFRASGELIAEPVGNNIFAFSTAKFLAYGTSFGGFYSGLGVGSLSANSNPAFDRQLAFLDFTTDHDVFPEQSTKIEQEDWDALDTDPDPEVGEFCGTFHYDVTFDSTINGYDFQVFFATHAVAKDGMASTSSSVGLFDVTDVSGNPLSNFEISFTSGRILTGVVLGDVNQDGVVNLLDVGPFVDLISTGTFQIEADINTDGLVNLLDVGPFVAVISGSCL